MSLGLGDPQGMGPNLVYRILVDGRKRPLIDGQHGKTSVWIGTKVAVQTKMVVDQKDQHPLKRKKIAEVLPP